MRTLKVGLVLGLVLALAGCDKLSKEAVKAVNNASDQITAAHDAWKLHNHELEPHDAKDAAALGDWNINVSKNFAERQAAWQAFKDAAAKRAKYDQAAKDQIVADADAVEKFRKNVKVLLERTKFKGSTPESDAAWDAQVMSSLGKHVESVSALAAQVSKKKEESK